ncbi:MAG: ATP-binding cassette, subfamily bacterial [Acidimicrobiia bacterium]|nr:ATP-binding cassette, subfamily bacterial [Acidimicrobiia bacterium]
MRQPQRRRMLALATNQAARRGPDEGPHEHPVRRNQPQRVGPPASVPDPQLLVARDLRYGHPAQQPPVLNGCDVVVAPQARILLNGLSGAGKSTLAAVLAGLRPPSSGTLLLKGRSTSQVGDHDWRNPSAASGCSREVGRLLRRVEPVPRRRGPSHWEDEWDELGRAAILDVLDNQHAVTVSDQVRPCGL